MKLTAAQIAEAAGGRIHFGSENAIATSVSTDSRTIGEGDLFVAIRGERFDGNLFVDDALAAGAKGVVCNVPPKTDSGAFVIVVDDTTHALGAMARAWRRIVNPMLVAITGSSGKTTVKDLAVHLCVDNLQLLSTEGNRNNHIGLPLTLLNLTEEHSTAIVEMGMNHGGEIRTLTEIAEPSIGVLTNVGDAHLGNFRGIDELIAAKAELFTTMRRNTTAIVNADCERSAKIRESGVLPWEIITFGENPGAKIRATDVAPLDSLGWQFKAWFFKWDQAMRLPAFGRYQISNALAAASIALLLGVPPETIALRMATFDPPRMRSRVHDLGGITVISDCYNASPSAAVAAIRSFAETPGVKRRFVLLGDMAELGRFSEAQHRRVGAAAAEAGITQVITAGDAARWIAEEASAEGADAEHFPDADHAVQYLLKEMKPGDGLLVKGSRVARLERAIELLQMELTGENAAK